VFRGAKDKASVLVTAEIGPDVTLTNNNGIYHGQVNVSIVAVDIGGKIAAADNPVVTLNLRPTTVAAVSAYGFRATSRLDLKPGRYQLRIAAKDATSGNAGTVLQDLVVPDFSKTAVTMSQVLLASRGAARIATTTADLVLQGVLNVPPTAIREFDQTDTLTVLAEVYDNRTKGLEPVSVTTTITNEGGAVSYRSEERVQVFAFEPSRHAYRHRLEIPLKDLAPGRYVLTVTAQPMTAGADAVTRAVPLTIKAAVAATR
jgi:hypothetical protein